MTIPNQNQNPVPPRQPGQPAQTLAPAGTGTPPPTLFRAKAVSSGPAPEGTFYCVFVTTEAVPPREWEGKLLEEGVRFLYEVSHGQHKGRRLGVITGTAPSERNLCGRILVGMFGRPIGPNDEFDVGPLFGQTFLVTVQGGKIVNVSLPPDVNV